MYRYPDTEKSSLLVKLAIKLFKNNVLASTTLILCYLKFPFYRSVNGNLLKGSVPPAIWSNITFTENRTLIVYDNLYICSLLIPFEIYFCVR